MVGLGVCARLAAGWRGMVCVGWRGVRGWCVLLVVVCVFVGCLGFGCSGAFGLVGRGHVFGFVFGVGGGVLGGPGGVAVDEVSGEVFVVDSGGERVERFRPVGGGFEFVSSFGVDDPGAIAVDNAVGSPSRGDVYVVGGEAPGVGERDFVYKFTGSGEKLFRRSVFKAKEGGEPVELELEDIQGLAVDASGGLWVYWGEAGYVDGFNDGESNKWLPSLISREYEGVQGVLEGCMAREDFGVASGGGFYTGYERENTREECPGEQGETADRSVVAKLDGSGTGVLSREVDLQNTTGVAVQTAAGAGEGDVYLDNGSSVAAFTAGGLLIQRFGVGDLSGGGAVAVDGVSGDVFVVEPAQDRVAVFLPAQEGGPAVDGVSSRNLTVSSAELDAVIDPDGVETEYYFQYGTVDCDVMPSGCVDVPVPAGEIAAGFGDQSVSVQVGGLAAGTAYFYRVLAVHAGAGVVVGTPSPNTFTTLPSPGVLPDGRAWEMVSPVDKHGAQIEASPLNGAMIESSVGGGAVTWIANGPLVSEPLGSRSPESTQLLSVRGVGEWQTQSLETPHHAGQGIEAEPIPSEYQAFSPDLALSIVQPAIPVAAGEPLLGHVEQPPLSPAASEKTIYLRDDPPLEPSEAERSGYELAGSEANRAYLAPGYAPLVAAGDDTAGTQFGGGLEFLGATADLSRVVFSSDAGLLSSPLVSGGLYEWEAGSPLKLLSVLPDGAPAGNAFLGDGEGQSSSPGLNARDAISSDGSRVFFTEGKEHLYLRDSQRSETIQVNAAQGHDATEASENGGVVVEPGEEQQEVHFQTASVDGSRVFFTDTARLTEDSTLEPIEEGEGPADLYEFEVTSAGGEALRGRLVDLTPESAEGSADVLNLIPGASEDASIVYFVANGVLAQGALPGDCPRYYGEQKAPPAGATCNLYVSEPDPEDPGLRETRFIAVLSDEDAADWGAGLSSHFIPAQDLSTVTSRVSPNGQYLAFMSQQSLTGYDNEDITSKHAGERLDEEVFLYEAASGRLLCASCNPGGQRPAGVFDTQHSGEGLGLLVDRSENWSGHWLAASLPAWTLDYGHYKSAVYQPRYLSDSGRLFFDSPDALVPEDQNAKEDVYEYEPDTIGSCQYSGGCVGLISSGTSTQESAFLDASENGDNAFFLTAAPLVPQDQDEAFDIYDARVCSENSPCFSSPAGSSQGCEATAACRPASSPQPQVAVPPSSVYSGPGNIIPNTPTKPLTTPKPLTRTQLLARALKACKKHRKKHKRAACEAQARKHYPARHTTKKKRS
jgi:hypothetical protein